MDWGDMTVAMSESDIPEAIPSFGERRGHRLAPLQTNFSRPAPPVPFRRQQPEPAPAPVPKSQASKLQRPRPNESPSLNGEEASPLNPVKHQSSKGSLRSLFSREKPPRPTPSSDGKLAEIDEGQLAQGAEPGPDETPLSPSIASPRTARSTPSLASPTTPRPRTTLKTARPRPANTKPAPPSQYGWKPPALFQAYPQSTKSECLPAPSISADSILRLHAGKNGNDPHTQLGEEDAKKREQREQEHLRTLSDTINKVEWTKKIYVLATAGYILHDAIPGKHWVVQVSQNPSAAANTAPEPPKSRFGRLGFHRPNARRLAGNFLLVLEDPDSMISWLTAIRAEIEIRGGPHVPTEKFFDDGLGTFGPKPGVRQVVKKDPHRISSLFLQPQAQNLRIPDDEEDGRSVGGTSMTWQSRRSSFVSDSHRSAVESRADSVSTAWGESSGVASGSEALNSSFASSMTSPTSPPIPNGTSSNGMPIVTPKADAFPSNIDGEYPQITPANSPPVGRGKRQSLYEASPPPTIPLPARPDGTQGTVPQPNIPEAFSRSTSPTTNNYSVPSFSRKFIPRQGLVPVSYPATSGGEIDGFSFTSPPQSPTPSVSSRQTDASEATYFSRDSTTRRVLRPSNSEDVLSRTIRSTQNMQYASRTPRAKISHEVSPPPSRPLSLVGRSGLGIQTGNGMPPQSPPSEVVPVPAPVPRPRVSTAHDVQKVMHRKSMPGLNLGPPIAPPP
ncbi:hypothetical protein N7470_005876 [Penicillium chermesinum]|nr:hypothetical protein N7470_005876 [Penicillium chermesinum]